MSPNRYSREDTLRALQATVFAFETLDAAGGNITVGQRGCLADALDAFENSRYQDAIMVAQAAMRSTCISKGGDGALDLTALIDRFDALRPLSH
jgi:hypothetical protein